MATVSVIRQARFRAPRLSSEGLVLLCLVIFLMIWAWTVGACILTSPGPNGSAFGADFSHTQSALIAIRHGLNPYNYQVLYQVQRHLLLPHDLPVGTDARTVLVGTSPFYLWLLQPLSLLPFQLAAVVWMVSTTLLSAIGLWSALHYLGWRRKLVPCAIFLALPATVLATFWGNTIDLAFVGMTASLPLLRRYPVAAGMLLSLTFLKIPAACPIALLVILFLAERRWHVIAGYLVSVLYRTVLAAVALGPQAVTDWLRGLFSFSQYLNLQPNLIGLSGIYATRLGHAQRAGLEAAIVAAALGVTIGWYRRCRARGQCGLLESGWLWGVWLLATPYAHFADEMLLAIPVAAVLGRDGARLAHPLSIATLTLWVGSVFLFSAQYQTIGLLWLPLAGLTVCLALASGVAATAVEDESHVAIGVVGLCPPMQPDGSMTPA